MTNLWRIRMIVISNYWLMHFRLSDRLAKLVANYQNWIKTESAKSLGAVEIGFVPKK